MAAKYLLTALLASALCVAGWCFEQYMQSHYGRDCTWLTPEDA